MKSFETDMKRKLSNLRIFFLPRHGDDKLKSSMEGATTVEFQ